MSQQQVSKNARKRMQRRMMETVAQATVSSTPTPKVPGLYHMDQIILSYDLFKWFVPQNTSIPRGGLVSLPKTMLYPIYNEQADLCVEKLGSDILKIIKKVDCEDSYKNCDNYIEVSKYYDEDEDIYNVKILYKTCGIEVIGNVTHYEGEWKLYMCMQHDD